MAGFDPVAARKAAESFVAVLNDPSSTVDDIRAEWKEQYLQCGHKALGRLMVGKSVDEACKSFRDK